MDDWSEPGKARREQILEVARELIARFGFRKTTMEDIARAARVAKATLYHYFTSKEDILREIIRREGNVLRTRLQQAASGPGTPAEKLAHYARTRFHYLRTLALYYRAMSEEFYSHMPFVERERREFDAFELDTLERLLLEGVERGDFEIPNPRLYAFLLLQAMKGLEYPLATGKALQLDGQTLELDDALGLLLGILLHGIQKAKPTQ